MANKKAIYSTDWIVKRDKNLKLYSKDSIGFHLNRVINHNTFFVDNQEEYRGLQNSGLIELIENEKVVSALQQKYVLHGFFKDLEDSIRDKAEYLFEFSYKNLKYQSDSLDNQGYIIDRTYSGNKIIPSHLIEIMFEKKELHVFYTRMIKARLKADNNLAELIKNEISTK